MYQKPRRKIIEEGEAAPPQIPPSWPQQLLPQVIKREPAAGSSPESQTGDSRAAESQPMVEIQGVYIISVAARILEMHPQTLRKYERLGLVNPERTGGMLRLYSREDIRKILLIRHLMDNLGLNLAGVVFALNLVENLVELERRLVSAVAGTALRETMKETIEQEVSRLYRRLNLPV